MTNAIIARPYARIACLFIALMTPADGFACACGCGVFDVGTSSMLPTQEGGMMFMDYDFMNQNKNWHGTSSSAEANNTDKNIKSSFFTVGGEYMWNRAWGTEVDVPYVDRHFTTDVTGEGDVQRFDHAAFGDVRIKGIYSGFSPDMSSGVTFGLKLPTGDYKYANFDRDIETGSGSTDILLGAYHMGNLAGEFNWFADLELNQPALIQAGYRPGAEADAVTGIYYNGWNIGNVKIAPLAQIIGSDRLHDRGVAADPLDSGYQRVLLAPGVEVDTSGWKLYVDIAVPVYQDVKGNQLTAPELFKFNISHNF